MRYGSVCSGIEAATAAWHHMGWEAAFFSEIEKFPCAVLEHRYPDVPLHGDFTTIKENEYGKIDLLVGGTPCQSFSVAGLRGGLDDDRGNLALEFCRLAQREQPRWIVWENVPGVLSSSGGRDFGSILGALEDLGYGLAYRVLDAQYFGVAQRRRRVFVVGYLGDASRAAKVLFERESVCRNPAPSREKGKGVATNVAASSTVWRAGDNTNAEVCFDHAGTLNCTKGQRGGIVATAFESNRRDGARVYGDTTNTLQAFAGTGGGNSPMVQVTAIGTDCYNGAITGDVAATLGTPGSSVNASGPTVMQSTAVRRLTPMECERLQGFPDSYTAIPWKKKTADQCPDGPRYKALGNSMAVPVMRWIGERINKVEKGLTP